MQNMHRNSPVQHMRSNNVDNDAGPPKIGNKEAGALSLPLAHALPDVCVPADVQPIKAQVRLLQEEAAPAAPAGSNKQQVQTRSHNFLGCKEIY
jgi:hypothetical protein